MIFDRKKHHVQDSLTIIEEKVKKYIPLTSEDIETLERGTLTVNTLNRIEGAQMQLREKLNEMGYFNNSISNKSWNDTDYFTELDLKRIVDNTIVLKKSFFSEGTPRNPKAHYDYIEINLIEKTLYVLGEISEYVKNQYKQCGTFQCGG